MNSPIRGEIWWADLEPTRGDEINKKRPVVVLSSDDVGVLAIKLIAPITGRPPSRASHPWLVQVRPTKANGLTKDGCVDVLQLRGIALERFSKRIGGLSPDDMDDVLAAIALVMEMDC
ncbi:type II toxin-antitoxin system PemK/MazF family toxin [Anaerosoma tenue]|uniref:type II toxin-antitoxin system PemK/MazF family toxin n=1 Tax=Anaerosoma tenue TaxID=2933588 RepID=UPI002260BA6C|nr:type II toxin-antitoxin system PemK/MazF family toxin [Anaerosoma tenue]MCK8114798.1 type II toxin-antitoxin system PemK/MazF family toxin [Anaerosoma tenue]